jgi:hypothetical protein
MFLKDKTGFRPHGQSGNMQSVRLGSSVMEANMTQQEHEAAVAAFILAKGVTRCPTACVGRTQGSVGDVDRLALRQRDEQIEARRDERRLRETALNRFGAAA